MKAFAGKLMLLTSLSCFCQSLLAQDPTEKEKLLEVREAALKEQLLRHEKTIEDLRSKYETEKKSLQEAYKKSEEDWKKKFETKEQELKRQTGELQALLSKKMESTIQVYEKMEPKSAAKILEDMEIRLSVQILSKIKPQKAAEILGKMNSERARLLTEVSLGKRPLASTNTRKVSQEVNEVQERSPIAPIGTDEKNQERR